MDFSYSNKLEFMNIPNKWQWQVIQIYKCCLKNPLFWSHWRAFPTSLGKDEKSNITVIKNIWKFCMDVHVI